MGRNVTQAPASFLFLVLNCLWVGACGSGTNTNPPSKPINSSEGEPTQQPILEAGTAAGQEWDGNRLRMNFCWCPPGSFRMGSPESEIERGDGEGPVDVIITKGFWLGKYELTQAQWQQVMGTSVEHQRSLAFEGAELHGEGADLPMY